MRVRRGGKVSRLFPAVREVAVPVESGEVSGGRTLYLVGLAVVGMICGGKVGGFLSAVGEVAVPVESGKVAGGRAGYLVGFPGVGMICGGEIRRFLSTVFLCAGRAVERDKVPVDGARDSIRLFRVEGLDILPERVMVCRREVSTDNIALAPRAGRCPVLAPRDSEVVPVLCRHEHRFRRCGVCPDSEIVRRVRQYGAVEDGNARPRGRQ